VTKTGLLLLLQGIVLAAIVAFVVTSEPVSVGPVLRQLAPPASAQVATHPEEAVVEEPTWLALEKLEYMEGPWTTEDGELLVSVSNRAAAGALDDPDSFLARGWRLVVEWDRGPVVVCGLYESIQAANPPFVSLPWRLAYCLGLGIDSKGPAVATRVSLLRSPGQMYLRLVVGSEIDVLIYQVE
jgi:hypothetical protein